MRSRLALAFGLAILTLATASPARTVTFPHADATRLYPGQRDAGAAWLPDGPLAGALPVVVILHGLNYGSALRPWMGDGAIDLRPILEGAVRSGSLPPLVLAAPTQTRDAVRAKTLWTNFDLGAFLDDVDRALEPVLARRDQVVVVGHSGAGCNPVGGLATAAASSVAPLALVAVDPCLDEESAVAFAQIPPSVPVFVRWQSLQWPRDVSAFERAFDAAAPAARFATFDFVRVDAVPGADPHRDVLPLVLVPLLGTLLGGQAR
jgi:hypothetical protein